MLFDRVENLLGEPKYRYHHVIWLHGRIRDPPKIFIDETFLFLFFSFLFFFYFFLRCRLLTKISELCCCIKMFPC